jgi:hypothetical protein
MMYNTPVEPLRALLDVDSKERSAKGACFLSSSWSKFKSMSGVRRVSRVLLCNKSLNTNIPEVIE